MIEEKINLPYDLSALRADVVNMKANYPIISQSVNFGGWSITSSDGDYRDGWQQGHKVYEKNPDFQKEKLTAEFKKIGMKDLNSYHVKTNVCTPAFSALIDTLEANGLYPRRCRVIELKAGGFSSWHRDASDDQYAVRLHIPIITNPGCLFKTETEEVHMPADGSCYLIKVNRMHQVVNIGTQDRYHFVCNVRDTKGLSAFHRL